MSFKTSEIKLVVNNKKVNTYLASPEKGGPGILLIHAWWGLKPFFKQLCDRLAEHGYVAFAPDLRNGEIAKTIDEAKALMQKSDGAFVGDIVRTAKEYLLALPQRRNGKIGAMGFSMGAAWSLEVAANDPDTISCAVLFYGSEPVDFRQVHAKILGHYAEVDEWEPLDGIKTMEADMQAAGVDATLHIYPKVGHWFVEPDRPEYDTVAAELAWSRTFEFLEKNLS